MRESLADIESLVLRCNSEQSREHMTEAIRCYGAGAYRAAIVSTWIAIVFDLIDKIRELSVSGDAKAEDIEKQFETYMKQIEEGNEQGVKKALEFERDILATCKDKLQFFDQQEFIDLCRLRDDRHRCAHPSFRRIGAPYHPSAEQARLHIRNAVVHVLGQPPVRGKAALDELRTLVSSDYFPTDAEGALLQLKNSPLRKPTDPLVKNFVDQLLFGFVDKQSPHFHKRQAKAAINAVAELHPVLVEGQLTSHLSRILRALSDEDFLAGASLVAHIPLAWRSLDVPAKAKIVQFVQSSPPEVITKALRDLYDIEELRTEVDRRIASLSIEHLSQAIQRHRLGALGKERALQLLSESFSYNKVNETFSGVVMPLFESLTRPDIERIIRFPIETKADLVGANMYYTFLESVRKTNLFTNDELDDLLRANNAIIHIEKGDEENSV